jgi:hypothetical protein
VSSRQAPGGTVGGRCPFAASWRVVVPVGCQCGALYSRLELRPELQEIIPSTGAEPRSTFARKPQRKLSQSDFNSHR